jgi:hypothetical protein
MGLDGLAPKRDIGDDVSLPVPALRQIRPLAAVLEYDSISSSEAECVCGPPSRAVETRLAYPKVAIQARAEYRLHAG